MIEATKNELFPITVSLFDEETATLIAGQEVVYDIRYINDTPLSPPISGTLTESSVEGGIYKTEVSLPTAGSFICYAFCTGFITSTEDIVINDESAVEVAKYNLPHNISVIDVVRTDDSNPSQLSRNVPLGKTDYIVTLIKRDDDLDWSNPVSSGTSYAHYTLQDQDRPYMMGGPY